MATLQEAQATQHTVPAHFGMWAGEINEKYEPFVIRTTEAALERLVAIIQTQSKVDNTMAFRSIYHSVNRFTREEVSVLHDENGQRWADWCDDVGLFYACRHVLLGRDIPFVELGDGAVQVLEHRISQQHSNINNGI